MKRHLYYIVFLLLLATTSLYSRQYSFITFGTEEGLPNNCITNILQDDYGFIWMGTRDGLCVYDGYSFRLFEDEEFDSTKNGTTRGLCKDKDGMIWFVTSNGIGYFNPLNGESHSILYGKDGVPFYGGIHADNQGNVWTLGLNGITKYSKDSQAQVYNQISAFYCCADSNGDIWVSSFNQTLYKYNHSNNEFEPLKLRGLNNNQYIKYLSPSAYDGLLGITNDNQVKIINYYNGACTDISIKHLISQTTDVTSLAGTKSEIWIGTREGVIVYDYASLSLTHLKRQANDSYSLSGNNVISLMADREGNIWVGTFYNGVNLLKSSTLDINTYSSSSQTYPLLGNSVKSITYDNNNSIWAGTEDGGLNKIDLRDGTISHFSTEAGLPVETNYHSLLAIDDNLWIAAYEQGLIRMSISKEKVIKKYDVDNKYGTFIYQLKDSSLLVGTNLGLYEYNAANDDLTHINELGTCFVHSIYEDSRGNLWIGTYRNGIWYRLNNEEDWHNIAAFTNGLRSNYIVSIYEDRYGQIWMGTEGAGLCYTDFDSLNEGSPEFKHITRADGLSSNIICSITSGTNGNLILSTTNGLIDFNPISKEIEKVYIANDSSIGNHYTYNSVYRMFDGRIYMGTTNGMISLYPETLKESLADSKISVISIKSMTPELSDKIRIKHKDANNLTILFSPLSYSNLETPLYEYSMRKGSMDISGRTTNNSLSFNNLSPGTYSFSVDFAGTSNNNSGKYSSIIITPPFYASFTAYLLYILLLGLISYAGFKVLKRHKDIKEAERRAIIEAETQKEILDSKMEFFTNITHEFRTPLTMIKLPLEKIISEGKLPKSAKDDLLLMQESTNRMLNLTNQLLDIRKIEKKERELSFSRMDVCENIRHCKEFFWAAAKERGINIVVNLAQEPIMIMGSADTINKILDNLVSNAVKYCKDEIIINAALSANNENVIISITSNGDPIPDKYRDSIFQPFFQIKKEEDISGTGLGLPFAQSLANLHKGRLYLDNSVSDRNRFILELPVTQDDALSILTVKEVEPKIDSDIQYETTEAGDKKHILIVEDDTVMRNFLARELSADYFVLQSSNGSDALEKIKSERVDLVLSDIVMPIMGGTQLCGTIKSSLEYSHIPIILMTAAAGPETRIETLDMGADGYIEKPFSMELVKANIANLFRNMDMAYQRFSKMPLTQFSSVSTGSIDQSFMEKLHDVIMEHISEQELNLDKLTVIIGTSKSTLYRKVKANTDLNINEYIRLCRLKKSAELLASMKYRINEVAYMVGFSSPSYFTASFQKQFNISPSAFIKQIRNNEKK